MEARFTSERPPLPWSFGHTVLVLRDQPLDAERGHPLVHSGISGG